jgi:hypothetical protein
MKAGMVISISDQSGGAMDVFAMQTAKLTARK